MPAYTTTKLPCESTATSGITAFQGPDESAPTEMRLPTKVPPFKSTRRAMTRQPFAGVAGVKYWCQTTTPCLESFVATRTSDEIVEILNTAPPELPFELSLVAENCRASEKGELRFSLVLKTD